MFILCGCIASLSRKNFVSCSLIICSWLMLCYATSDLSVHASLKFLVYITDIWH